MSARMDGRGGPWDRAKGVHGVELGWRSPFSTGLVGDFCEASTGCTWCGLLQRADVSSPGDCAPARRVRDSSLPDVDLWIGLSEGDED